MSYVAPDYHPTSLTEFIHKLPRATDVTSFAPTDKDYYLGLAPLPVALCVIGLFCLLVWPCTLCCCKTRRRQGCWRFIGVLACLFVLGGVASGLTFNSRVGSDITSVEDTFGDFQDKLVHAQDLGNRVQTTLRSSDTTMGELGTSCPAITNVDQYRNARQWLQDALSQVDQYLPLASEVTGDISTGRGYFRDGASTRTTGTKLTLYGIGALAVACLLATALTCIGRRTVARVVLLVSAVVCTFSLTVVWVVLGVTAAAAIISADFCVDPNANLLRQLPSGNVKDTAAFYLSCVGSDPLQAPIHDARGFISEAQDNLRLLKAYAGVCADPNQARGYISVLLNDTDAGNGFLTEVQSITNCSTINPLYVDVVQTGLCGHGLESVSGLWASVLACSLALMFVVTSLRCSSTRPARDAESALFADVNGEADALVRGPHPLHYGGTTPLASAADFTPAYGHSAGGYGSAKPLYPDPNFRGWEGTHK